MDLFPSKILLTEKNYLEFKQNYSETLKIVQIKSSKWLKAQTFFFFWVVSWLCKNGWPITLESRCKLFPEHRLEISTTAGRDCNRAGLLSLSDLCQWTSHLWYQQVVNICCFLKLCMAEGRFQVSWTKMHRLIYNATVYLWSGGSSQASKTKNSRTSMS